MFVRTLPSDWYKPAEGVHARLLHGHATLPQGTYVQYYRDDVIITSSSMGACMRDKVE